jgi:glycosyltransferase involved in cell wall biosynthesis
MRICVDIQAAVTQRAGIGRYTRQLVRHLDAILDHDELALFYFDFRRRGAPIETRRATTRIVRCCPGAVVQACWRALDWPPFPWFAGGADVYHFPNFTIPPLTRGARAVATIHDLSFLRYPEHAEEKNRRILTQTIRRTVARADAILTDSRFGADELAELLAVAPDRVFPVHLGVEEDFQPRPPAQVAATLTGLGIRQPYLLAVGTLEPRKNIPFLVEVYERLTDFKGPLVIAGAPGWKYEPILARLRASPRAADIRFIRYVPDGQLPALYTGAALFLQTSFYEGFGLPPLEAMACGTPVLSSSGGSLAEVLGDAALRPPAFDADLWAAEARRALGDAALRARLIADGRARAARYRWSETARHTLEVYRCAAR